MLLLDEVELVDVTRSENTQSAGRIFSPGTFSGTRLSPGLYLRDDGAVLLPAAGAGQLTPYYTGMNNVKFKNMVLPGDTVEFRCEPTRKSAFFIL